MLSEAKILSGAEGEEGGECIAVNSPSGAQEWILWKFELF